MTLLQPAALGFLALVPVIVVFYILRAQHQQQQIPSTLFWRNISSDLEGRPSWRLPLRNLLLLLQIIIVALIALALARPSLLGGTKQHLIVVLDASVSMQASDILPSRFEAAKNQARDLISGLAAGDDVTLIRADRSPSILETASGQDRSAVLAALAGATPSGSSADMFAALALASSLAGQHPDARNEVVVLSDGVFPRVDLAKLGSPRADLRLQLVGQSAKNVAVSELSVRPMLGTVGRHIAFARATNYGDAAVEVPLTALADGIPIDSRKLKLPPGGAAELTLNLPAGTGVVEIRLETDDYLRIDDQAQAVVPSDKPINVTLVSNNTLIWDRFFRAMPLLKVTRVRPIDYKPRAADVTIFDGWEPPTTQWPAGSVLVVNPVPSGKGIDAAAIPVAPLGETGPVQVIRAAPDSPLLDGVDLAAVTLSKSVRVTLPAWGRAVVDTAEGPLVFDGQLGGRKVAVFAFDPLQSELPQRLAFPILVANTLTWLAPVALPDDLTPGSVVDLQPAPNSTEIVVRLPSGKAQAFQPGTGPIRFAQTDAVGRYVVTQRSGDSVVAQDTFVVNATDDLASNIRPRPDALGAGLANASDAAAGVQRETWPWLAAAALAFVSGEWWYYCRKRA